MAAFNLPKDVIGVTYHSNGEIEYLYSAFPLKNRWPGVVVDSSPFSALSVPEKFFEQSVAFLQAAKVLCEAAGQAGKDLCWSQGAVCYYCLNLATELFLKACILRSTGEAVIPTHEISSLLARYRKILPAPKFEFPTPWEISKSELERAIGCEIFGPIDRNPDQLFRYGVDRMGKGSTGTQFFTPSFFFDYVTHLGTVWRRAWNEVSTA